MNNNSFIHPDARIGKNVEIGPFCYICGNVEIGDGCKIGPNVVIYDYVKIGRNCTVFPGAVLGGVPQDLKFAGEVSYVEVGDNTVIRECVTIHRATGEGQETRIGNDCLLMATVHIAHNCLVGNRVIMSNAAMLAGHVVVEDNAVIGGQPAQVYGLNNVGITRAGISMDSRRALKKAYKLLYRSGLTLAKAITVIEQEVESCEEVEHFLRFLRDAERGICRSHKETDKE